MSRSRSNRQPLTARPAASRRGPGAPETAHPNPAGSLSRRAGGRARQARHAGWAQHADARQVLRRLPAPHDHRLHLGPGHMRGGGRAARRRAAEADAGRVDAQSALPAERRDEHDNADAETGPA
ncbi:hypothetical protein ACFQZ4_52375 [Catellatospora coxensis]